MVHELRDDPSAVCRAIAVHLSRAYNMQRTVRSVVRGVNWTFVAGTEGRKPVWIRLYRAIGRSANEIEAELAVLRSIAATPALDVARPLPDCHGQLALPVTFGDGSTRIAAVFEDATGRPIEHTPSDMTAAGRALADLHRQAVALASIGPQRSLIDPAAIEQTLALMAAHSRAGRDAAETIAHSLDTLRQIEADRTTSPIGFCHGDFRDANLRIEGDRVTMFDFDDCGIGPIWLDVATMAWWIEMADPATSPYLWQAFKSGYGVPDDHPNFDLSLRWLIAIQQLRSTRFLLDYCELAAHLWAEMFNNTADMISRAASGDLRIFREG